MNDNETPFGARFKIWRLTQKLTQEQCAHKIGCTVGTVARWESGKFTPKGIVRKVVEQQMEDKR